jgi:membrane protein insertase Oxa1/YidC/SpoIIIJ
MHEYCICIILMAVSTHASNALSEENFKFTQNYTNFLAIFSFMVFTSPASLLLCTGLVLSILINIFLFPCNSKIVQP